AELDDQPGGLCDLRVFDDMAEMLCDAGKYEPALEWCQAGLDRVARAGDATGVAAYRRGLLSTRGFLRDEVDIEYDDEDLAARAARGYAAAGAARVRSVSANLADYEAYARRERRDPADRSTRQDYGEWCALTHPDQVQPWPPARNALCWCDSGRKYKKCCGTPA